MTTMTRTFVAAAMAALLAFTAQAQPPAPPAAVAPPAAAAPPASTVTIPEMDCASCAKKVGGKLAEVPGVEKVEYDVKARTIRVTHKAGATPSQKALWEAVENGGKDPSRLDVPGGTFTKKPAG